MTGAVDFQAIAAADWFGIPLHQNAMGLFAIDGSPEFISALFTILPIALATMMEHVAISPPSAQPWATTISTTPA